MTLLHWCLSACLPGLAACPLICRYGFNPGSHYSISSVSDALIVARTATNTTISGAAGALLALILQYYRTHTYDLLSMCTGGLAGLVAITASCAAIEPWAALICGALSGIIYVYAELLLERLKVSLLTLSSAVVSFCPAAAFAVRPA